MAMGAPQDELFPWREEYYVGIAFADAQHRQLADIINRLHQALVDGQERSMIAATLDELIRYTQAHFVVEEEVLHHCGYPDFLAHHSQHKRLANAVLAFYQMLMSNEMEMTAHAADFLKQWMGEEIMDIDMKFASFLKGKGVP